MAEVDTETNEEELDYEERLEKAWQRVLFAAPDIIKEHIKEEAGALVFDPNPTVHANQEGIRSVWQTLHNYLENDK